MISSKIFVLFGVITLLTFTSASPDSAGIVELPPGLAYGGIPYGSVSGMLARYQNSLRRADYSAYEELPRAAAIRPYQQYRQVGPSPVIVTPNFRASGIEARRRGPVQIYNLPGVIAPGVVGTFSQIGY